MQDANGQDGSSGLAKGQAAAQPAAFVASRSDSHTPRGTPSARANLSAPSHSSSNTSASHVHPSPPSSAVRHPVVPNGLSWRHTPMHAFDAPAPAIPQHGGRSQLQPPQSRASLPSKGRHGSFQMPGVGPTASVASVPSSVTDVSAFEGATDEGAAPQGRRVRSHASMDQKRNSANDRLPYPTTGPQTPSGRLVHTPRCVSSMSAHIGRPASVSPAMHGAAARGCLLGRRVALLRTLCSCAVLASLAPCYGARVGSGHSIAWSAHSHAPLSLCLPTVCLRRASLPSATATLGWLTTPGGSGEA